MNSHDPISPDERKLIEHTLQMARGNAGQHQREVGGTPYVLTSFHPAILAALIDGGVIQELGKSMGMHDDEVLMSCVRLADEAGSGARGAEPTPEPACDPSGDVPDEATLAALRELNAEAPPGKAPHCRCEPPLVGELSRLDPRVKRALLEQGLTAAFGTQVQIDQEREFLEYLAGGGPLGPTILDEAAAAVDGDRERDYGHPLDDFSCVAEAANALVFRRIDRTTGEPRPLVAEDHPIYLGLVKLAREYHRPGRDNMVDGAGYWRTLEKVKAERERRERREGS